MDTMILRVGARYLLPLILLFSVFLLVRGHNAPGGGFSGGLAATAGLVLYAFAHGVPQLRRVMGWNPRLLIPLGLLLAIGSGLPALLAGQPFLAGEWASLELAGLGELKLGTPLVFDVGVYLVVIGMSLSILLALEE